MNGYIKYFEYGNPNMFFFIKDEEVEEKYEQIWDVIKNKLKINFHSEPVYEHKYLKTKVKEYDDTIKTHFLSYAYRKKIYNIPILLVSLLILLLKWMRNISRKFI